MKDAEMDPIYNLSNKTKKEVGSFHHIKNYNSKNSLARRSISGVGDRMGPFKKVRSDINMEDLTFQNQAAGAIKVKQSMQRPKFNQAHYAQGNDGSHDLRRQTSGDYQKEFFVNGSYKDLESL